MKGLITILPSISFNHCMVAAETGAGLVYLDPTAKETSAGYLPYSIKNSFSLLIKNGVKKPEHLIGTMIPKDIIISKGNIKLAQNNSILVAYKSKETGEPGTALRTVFRNKSDIEKKRIFNEFLTDEFNQIELNEFAISNLDTLDPDVLYNTSFIIHNYVTTSSNLTILKTPWFNKLSSNSAFSSFERKYPYLFEFEADSIVQDIEIQIPIGYTLKDKIDNQKFINEYAEYTLEAKVTNNVLKLKRTFHCKNNVIPANDFTNFKNFWYNVVNEDERLIMFEKIKK